MRPSTMLPCRCIVLIGFMGAGKTTTGAALARLLGWKFVDLDDSICDEAGKPIADIFSDHGEPHFRAAEARHLANILAASKSSNPTVLAVGGGAVENPESHKLLASAPDSCIIYLEAPLPVLLSRCHTEHDRASAPIRPLLSEAEIRYGHRVPLYESIGTPVSTYGFSAEDVASNIVSLLQMKSTAGRD
jgi:shikimate kinase